MRQDTREADDLSVKMPADEVSDDPFPSLDRERRDVDHITQRMMDARDEWEPPETPEYDPTADLQPALKTGTVRSIGETTKDGDTYVRLRVDDTQSPEPVTVDIKDTGEQAISNPWVRFLKMYGIHPEMPEDLYGQDIEFYVKSGDNTACIRPVILPARLIWQWGWMPHFRYGLVAYHTNSTAIQRYHPTQRYLPAYLGIFGAIYGGFHPTITVLADTVVGALLFLTLCLVSIVAVIGACWGLYWKWKRDWKPYLGEWTTRLVDIYQHRRV